MKGAAVFPRESVKAVLHCGNLRGEGMGEERRRHRRYTLELPVRCRVEEPAGGAFQNLLGHTLNMSEGGLALVLPTSLPPETDVTVLLDLPEGPAVAEATVVWAEPPGGEEEGQRHGLRIREMSPTHEVRWRQFLIRMASQAYSRRHGRLGVRLQIQCAVLGRPPREFGGRTVDMSPGGVQLLLPEALPVGTHLQLSLEIPMGPRSLEGEVVWCAPAEGGEHLVGVQFLQRSWGWSFLLDLAEREGAAPGESAHPLDH